MTTDAEALVLRAYQLAEGDVLDVRGFVDLFAEDSVFTGIGHIGVAAMFAQLGVLPDFASAVAASAPRAIGQPTRVRGCSGSAPRGPPIAWCVGAKRFTRVGRKSMITTNLPAARAGSFRVGDLDLNRIGYGAMQLAGPGVFGPPRDRAAAIEVLRTAVELGVNHIDTADAYGPYVTNEIIREALFPYGDHVHIVTKVGVVRDERGGWLPANSPQSLREQVHDNLRRLGLDVLDVVNLRTLAGIDDRATVSDTLTPQFEALAELQQQGLIRHLGVSTVSLDQLAEAQQVAAVVYVQNFYNIANRADAAVLAATAEQHIAYVPYFPLGGFSPLQSDVLDSVAKRLGATSTAVAQSWLLQHSPNIMLIPGTSSVDHLRENIAGAALALPPDAVAELDAI